jgi:topoisomerase-4 subunit A
MPRGKGVKLQAYREGGLRDGLIFFQADGAFWTDAAGRSREWPDWRDWEGKRAQAGKLVPKGFPVTKRFRPKS